MKRCILLMTLLVLLQASTGFCQEGEETNEEMMVAERQLDLRRMQLELQETEAEVEFRQQVRELELEERRVELEHQRAGLGHPGRLEHHKKKCAPLLILCFIVHVLLAVWVYQDIRKRNSGSGIWIVVTLLTGLLGVLVYAIVRIGDSRQTTDS